MPQINPHKTSRSLKIYGLLLNLYPQEYLQLHRAEMLQNFEEFERTSSSKVGLWLFIGRDLLISFMTHFTKSLWRQSTIVAVVLVVVLAIARHHPGQHEHSVWSFCYGYVVGWFSGWWRKGRQARTNRIMPNCVMSFWGQTVIICVVLTTVLAIAHKFSGAHEHAFWALCYGYLVAWPAGWLGKRWQLRH